MLNLAQVGFQDTTNKNVTGKQRLNHAHQPAPRRPLYTQLRMKHLQLKTLSQIRRRNMLMLGLGSRAVPCWTVCLHH
jgi:hypothetical protein